MTKRDEIHCEEKDELIVKLAKADKLALTIDGLTALTNESYIITTCPFINADWEIISCSGTVIKQSVEIVVE